MKKIILITLLLICTTFLFSCQSNKELPVYGYGDDLLGTWVDGENNGIIQFMKNGEALSIGWNVNRFTFHEFLWYVNDDGTIVMYKGNDDGSSVASIASYKIKKDTLTISGYSEDDSKKESSSLKRYDGNLLDCLTEFKKSKMNENT